MEKETFEKLLEKNRVSIERYVNFRMPSSHDADDVIQETYLAAFSHFDDLRDHTLFKSWMLSIARNKCSLWYRKRRRHNTIPLELLEDIVTGSESTYDDTVDLVLDRIPPDYARILRMTMDGMKHTEIADRLSIPVGTVKSRIYRAKELFRSVCPPEIKSLYERGKKMENKYTHDFPREMPSLSIIKTTEQVFDIRLDDEDFIIPKIGNRYAEATYRYPDRKLALVSECRVPKKALVHGAECVKICRDTFNVKENKMYKNEAIWFTQMTDEFIRILGTVKSDGDEEYPTLVETFLDEEFDVMVNGKDRIHGIPAVLKENPGEGDHGEIRLAENNLRYTMGVCSVSIGPRRFDTVRVMNNYGDYLTEKFFDRNSRLILMRWYEAPDSVKTNPAYSEAFFERVKNNPAIKVNGKDFILIEDRIGEYAM